MLFFYFLSCFTVSSNSIPFYLILNHCFLSIQFPTSHHIFLLHSNFLSEYSTSNNPSLHPVLPFISCIVPSCPFINCSYLAPFYSCFLLLSLILYHILFTCYFLLIFITYSGTSCHALRSHLILPYLTLTYFLCPITLPFNVFYFLSSTSTPDILHSFVFYYYRLSYFFVFFHAILLPLSLCYFLLLMLFSTVLLCIIYSTTTSHSLSLLHLIFSPLDLVPFILFCILPPHTTTCYTTYCHYSHPLLLFITCAIYYFFSSYTVLLSLNPIILTYCFFLWKF